ncbi:MAG: ribbon-helix-helix protein, CopG family [Vicinamibacterales bacterium]
MTLRSVRFDPHLESRLEALAKALGLTKSEVVREAVATYGASLGAAPSAAVRLQRWIGCVSGAGGSTAARRGRLETTFKEKARARGRPR